MSKFFALLISAALLSAQAIAGEVDVHLSGFATVTAFSDRDWHPNKSSAALNFDATYEDWAVRGQVASSYSQPIRRLVVERSIFITSGHELLLQAGRFPRLDSFYNSVTDSPATYGMAMLPPGMYNRRVIGNRTFTGIEGAQAIYTFRAGPALVKLHADYGQMVVEKQCETQNEATKMPCRPGYEISGVRGSYDFGGKVELGQWTALAYHGKLLAKTTLLNPLDKTSVFLTHSANRISYNATKIGLRYDGDSWYVQSEIMRNQFDLAKTGKDYTQAQESWNRYVIAGYCFTGAFCGYASYSHGKSTSVGSGANDRAVGATYSFDHLVMSLEYHKGYGKAWEKYNAPNPDWNSWVASATWRF